MLFFQILLLSMAADSFFLAGACLILHLILKSKRYSADTPGYLKQRKSKKNVPVYGVKQSGGPIHPVLYIKHLTKGIYHYTVNGKTYRKRYVEYVPFGEMPSHITVVYWKRFPRICYAKTDVGDSLFGIYSLVLAIWGVFSLLLYFGLVF